MEISASYFLASVIHICRQGKVDSLEVKNSTTILSEMVKKNAFEKVLREKQLQDGNIYFLH